MKRSITVLLIMSMLLSMMVFTNVFAADLSINNQKSYIDMSLENVNADDAKIEFKFNITDTGVQKLNIFAIDDEFTSDITWDNAPKNNKNAAGVDGTLVGSVIVKAAGEYSVDVTKLAKERKAQGATKMTFAICGEQRNGWVTDFSDLETLQEKTSLENVAYGDYGAFIRGGWHASGKYSANIVTTKDHTDGYGKSLRLTQSGSYRFKFYNGLKDDGMLTEDDIGRVFRVSFWALNPSTSGEKTNMVVGFMSAAKGNGTPENPSGSEMALVGDRVNVQLDNNDTWTEYSFDFNVTEEVVNKQVGMLTFNEDFPEVYIDDLSVIDISKSTTISGSDSSYIYNPDFDSMSQTAYSKQVKANTNEMFYSSSYYAYRPGGQGGTSIVISPEENYPSTKKGKSIKAVRDSQTYNDRRVKFYNVLKESALTSSDIGRTFEVSAMVKLDSAAGDEKATMTAGMLCENNIPSSIGYATNVMYGNKISTEINAKDWTEIKYTYTLDQKNIDYQIGMPTFTIKSDYIYYLDDFKVKEVSSQAGSTTKPRFVITNSSAIETVAAATNIAYIEDGSNEFEVMKNDDIFVNEKGYNKKRTDLEIIQSQWMGTYSIGEDYGYKNIIRNNTEAAIDIMQVSALYDENKTLVNIDYSIKSLDVNEVFAYTTNITLPSELTQDYSMKTFLWNGATMSPLNGVETYPKVYDEDEIIVKVNGSKTSDYSSFDVFVKGTRESSNKYTMYKFQYINNALTVTDYTSTKDVRQNAELYRVKTAFKTERTGEFEFTVGPQLLQEGEIEMAIRESGHNFGDGKGTVTPGDFIGGFHGDEHLSIATLKIDGVEIPLNESKNYVGKKVDFYQHSIVNRCNTPGDDLIDHTKDYSITAKDGIKLNQKAEWLQDTNIAIAYLVMFPMMRHTSYDERITDYVDWYWNDGTLAASRDFTDYLKSTLASTGEQFASYSVDYPHLEAPDKYIGKVVLTSAKDDIEATCETETLQGLTDRYAYEALRIYGDTKCYFGSNESSAVKAGDVWEVNNRYDIKLKD